MMEFKSLSGTKYVLKDKLMNKGGEGRIYEVANVGGAIAKLYNDELCTAHRERKLITMLRTPLSAELLREIAWPCDILYSDGRLAGFVMRKIEGGLPLNELWSSESLDMAKRLQIAKNLCVLINDVHSAGLTIGDLNPFNILVIPSTGMVRVIDVDSWHIYDKLQRGTVCYRCEVCIPEYLAPSVSNAIPDGQTLKTAHLPTFSQNSDLYSAAVLIFQLLMNGTHPFAVGLAKGSPAETVPKPTVLMKRHSFPYERLYSGCKLPIYALPYKVLSPRLQEMFIRVFSREESISVGLWYEAMSDFEEELSRVCKERSLPSCAKFSELISSYSFTPSQ